MVAVHWSFCLASRIAWAFTFTLICASFSLSCACIFCCICIIQGCIYGRGSFLGGTLLGQVCHCFGSFFLRFSPSVFFPLCPLFFGFPEATLSGAKEFFWSFFCFFVCFPFNFFNCSWTLCWMRQPRALLLAGLSPLLRFFCHIDQLLFGVELGHE